VPDRSAKIRKTFGETVRSERVARKLTQEKLAEKADLSLNFVGTVERGEQSPTLESVVQLANGLGVTAGELVTKAKL
jgi:transcriptional regulator with XRE-family HTH domain